MFVAMVGSTAFTTITTFGELVGHGEFVENDERAGRGDEGPGSLAWWLVCFFLQPCCPALPYS